MRGLLELGCQGADSGSSYMAWASHLASPRPDFLFCEMGTCAVKD